MSQVSYQLDIPASLSKSDLAEKYQISVRTLMRWLAPFKEKLQDKIDFTKKIFRKNQIELIVECLGPW